MSLAVPVRSGSNRQLVGLLCYDACPSGYDMVLGACRVALLPGASGGEGGCMRYVVVWPVPAQQCAYQVPSHYSTPAPPMSVAGTCWKRCSSGQTDGVVLFAYRRTIQTANLATRVWGPFVGADATATARTWAPHATAAAGPSARSVAADGAAAGPAAAGAGECQAKCHARQLGSHTDAIHGTG